MTWQGTDGPEKDATSSRNLYGPRLVEDQGGPSGAKSRLVHGLIAAVGIILQKLGRKLSNATPEVIGDAAQAGRDATELAAGAVAGKLEGASLEGELKRAQINAAYAEARKHNAEASRIEEDLVWDRIRRVIETADTLGAKAGITVLPDGTPCLVLGDLAVGLPPFFVQPTTQDLAVQADIVVVDEATPPEPQSVVVSSGQASAEAQGLVVGAAQVFVEAQGFVSPSGDVIAGVGGVQATATVHAPSITTSSAPASGTSADPTSSPTPASADPATESGSEP